MSLSILHSLPSLSKALPQFPLRILMTSATHHICASYPVHPPRIISTASRKHLNLVSARSFSGGGVPEKVKAELEKEVRRERVVVFMKGTKEAPRCGFSNTVVQILKALEIPFHTVDILEDDTLRQGLKVFSSWPTFPQLYIDGNFFGGCDITIEAYRNGQLKQLLEKAAATP